jgi:3-deoxy-manno-octulosonate cytidylyltransferase (CMP-KDO synthetase)
MPKKKVQNVICVIPARYGSERFPGKPLAELCDKPMIQWVYERAAAAKTVRGVMVATDDFRIYDAVESFGGNCVLTGTHYTSGTDRIADAVHGLTFDVLVNLQGDEPLMDSRTIDKAVRALLRDDQCDISTAMVRITDKETFLASSVVKVVTDRSGYALYFSRSPIPNSDRATPEDLKSSYGFKHLGLYVYRKKVLLTFPRLKPSPLEMIEKLEQLRFLENGFRIKLVETPYDSIGVDTPEDLERVRALMQKAIQK